MVEKGHVPSGYVRLIFDHALASKSEKLQAENDFLSHIIIIWLRKKILNIYKNTAFCERKSSYCS